MSIKKDFYTYPVSLSSALTAGSQATQSISIEADASFVWVKSCFFASLASAAQTDSSRVIPLINVQITDSGSGRNLQSAPVPISCMAGQGELPFILPVPREFKARSTINVTFNNFSTATDYSDVSLLMIGYKIFQMG